MCLTLSPPGLVATARWRSSYETSNKGGVWQDTSQKLSLAHPKAVGVWAGPALHPTQGYETERKIRIFDNYPLGPTQFEVEWKRLVDECGIADHPAIKALWEQKERWIATYFKGMYCGRMTSTQRLESQNRMLKDTPSFPVYKAYTYIKIQTFSSLTNNLTIKFLFL